eukprot:639857-Rhodomonas_salina.7
MHIVPKCLCFPANDLTELRVRSALSSVLTCAPPLAVRRPAQLDDRRLPLVAGLLLACGIRAKTEDQRRKGVGNVLCWRASGFAMPGADAGDAATRTLPDYQYKLPDRVTKECFPPPTAALVFVSLALFLQRTTLLISRNPSPFKPAVPRPLSLSDVSFRGAGRYYRGLVQFGNNK